MAQYNSAKTNTRVDVTNGSNVVTGVGTQFLANVQVGNAFTVIGDGVVYDISSVVNDTQITLSTNYSGATEASTHYAIHRDFTSPDNIPELNTGDIDTATIMKRLARTVQTKFNEFESRISALEP